MSEQFAIPKPKAAKGMLEESSEAYEYRQEIALFSLKRAAMRIHGLKEVKASMDPLKEDELIEESLKAMKGYQLAATEIADSTAVSRCQLSPDEKYFVTTGWSGECQVWTSVDTPRKVTTLAGHKYQVFDADFHPSVATNDPDSPNIATGGSDCILRLWSLDPSEAEQGCLELPGHEDRINRVKFHPNGLHVVTASYDKTAAVWDIEKEKQCLVLKGHNASIHALSLHPDGSLLFTGDLSAVGMLWDIRTGSPVLPVSGHYERILSSDFHSDGCQLATGSQDNTIKIWDIRGKTCLATVPAHMKIVSDLRFEKGCSRYLATCSYDGTAKIFSTRDYSERCSIATDYRLTSVVVTADRRTVLATCMEKKLMVYCNRISDGD